jgi:hypothetical protein
MGDDFLTLWVTAVFRKTLTVCSQRQAYTYFGFIFLSRLNKWCVWLPLTADKGAGDILLKSHSQFLLTIGGENEFVPDVLCLLYFRAVVIAVIISPPYSPNKARQLKSFRTEKKIKNRKQRQAHAGTHCHKNMCRINLCRCRNHLTKRAKHFFSFLLWRENKYVGVQVSTTVKVHIAVFLVVTLCRLLSQ